MGSAETWTDPRPLGHTFLKLSQMPVILRAESCNSRHIVYSGDTQVLFNTTPYVPWRPQSHLETPEFWWRSMPSEFGWGGLQLTS